MVKPPRQTARTRSRRRESIPVQGPFHQDSTVPRFWLIANAMLSGSLPLCHAFNGVAWVQETQGAGTGRRGAEKRQEEQNPPVQAMALLLLARWMRDRCRVFSLEPEPTVKGGRLRMLSAPPFNTVLFLLTASRMIGIGRRESRAATSYCGTAVCTIPQSRQEDFPRVQFLAAVKTDYVDLEF